MKLIILSFGKTHNDAMKQLVDDYVKRISRYNDIEHVIIKEPAGHTSLPQTEQKKKESALFIKYIVGGDYCVIMDENGKNIDSIAFSNMVQQTLNKSYKRMVFIIGGPYGFDKEILARADYKLALSAMTFPHELARVVLSEQIFRAFSILNNTPYHHY